MRTLNWQLWAGFLLAPAAFLSYPFVFERWPTTRDLAWAPLLIFGLSGVLLVSGLRRALVPGRRRVLRVTSGALAAATSAVIFTAFVLNVFVHARDLPPSQRAPRVGDVAPAFTLPDEQNTQVSLAGLFSPMPSTATPSVKGVLLVFSMYAGCRACNSEYRGIQDHLSDFLALGVRPVVISIDPPEVSRVLSQEAGYTFTFLGDPSLSVIRLYDVANGAQARPAEFLLDANRVVRWRNLTGSVFVRARPEQILGAIRRLPD